MTEVPARARQLRGSFAIASIPLGFLELLASTNIADLHERYSNVLNMKPAGLWDVLLGAGLSIAMICAAIEFYAKLRSMWLGVWAIVAAARRSEDLSNQLQQERQMNKKLRDRHKVVNREKKLLEQELKVLRARQSNT